MNTLFVTTYIRKELILWFVLSFFLIINVCSSIPKTSKKWPEKVLKKLSLREKIAQCPNVEEIDPRFLTKSGHSKIKD